MFEPYSEFGGIFVCLTAGAVQAIITSLQQKHADRTIPGFEFAN
jgi:hypothetical protein